MVDKSKRKAAMLLELESIKGLLRDEDDIPVLQEESDHYESDHHEAGHYTSTPEHNQVNSPAKVRGEQRDFFNSASMQDSAAKLLDSLSDFEKTTHNLTANKTSSTAAKQTPLAKANGENPFLPEHIRSRLHGNNPPPLFEIETARKIATTSKPKTFLGSTEVSDNSSSYPIPTHAPKLNMSQHAMIEDIVDNLLPILEKELRERLEFMTKEMLEDLLEKKQ